MLQDLFFFHAGELNEIFRLEGIHKATWKREFKVPWRKAGPPNHLDDKVDSNQQVVNQELSLSMSPFALRTFTPRCRAVNV